MELYCHTLYMPSHCGVQIWRHFNLILPRNGAHPGTKLKVFFRVEIPWHFVHLSWLKKQLFDLNCNDHFQILHMFYSFIINLLISDTPCFSQKSFITFTKHCSLPCNSLREAFQPYQFLSFVVYLISIILNHNKS